MTQVRDAALPALMRLDGFIGLSMMVDRQSGRCIATSAWQDHHAMHASAAQAQPVRNRIAEILGGGATVEEWEIAVMHRDHPSHEGACVRSTWLHVDPNRIGELVESFKTVAMPQLEGLAGFCSASFMMNRTTGRTVSSTCFESRTAMEASREQAQQIRAATVQFNATVLEVREFDLAVAHLRVPEMV